MQIVKINSIKANPSNPRLIKDDKFHKLVQSLKDFPEMAKVRPIVVNADMVILGGNMRFKAMQQAGWKEAPVEVVNWPEEKQREFIVKDNVGFGEWDWELLANEWGAEDLEKWGLDVPVFDEAGDIVELPDITTTYNVNIKCDDPLQVEELKERLGISSNSIHVIELYKLLL
jgi:ParB-like chromosome segregation protein Spo0J